jgi:hypothetical protein
MATEKIQLKKIGPNEFGIFFDGKREYIAIRPETREERQILRQMTKTNINLSELILTMKGMGVDIEKDVDEIVGGISKEFLVVLSGEDEYRVWEFGGKVEIKAYMPIEYTEEKVKEEVEGEIEEIITRLVYPDDNSHQKRALVEKIVEAISNIDVEFLGYSWRRSKSFDLIENSIFRAYKGAEKHIELSTFL